MAPKRSVSFDAYRRPPSLWGAFGRAWLALTVASISLDAPAVLATAHGRDLPRPHTRAQHGLPGQPPLPGAQPMPPVMTPPAEAMPAPPASAPTSAEESQLEPVMLEGGISIAIGADQRATVLGETQSLRAVIEEICRQAHIELRTYAAPDRRYIGKLENVPLTEALRSILRSESYLLGFRAGANGGEPARVTWMRVLGGQPGDTPGAMKSVAAQFAAPPSPMKVTPPPGSRFAMSTALMFQAFGTYDPVRRDQAQREMIDRINQPDEMQRFLGTDAKQLATMFGRYRDSEQTIRRLKSMSENPEVQAKFDEVLNEIKTPPEQQ
jgi:hypothetical protein